MTRITDIDTNATMTIRLALEDAPEMQGKYSNTIIAPESADLSFRYTATTDGGYTWILRHAKATGPRVLKPAPDGSQRLGKQIMSADWYGFSDSSAETEEDFPEWLASIVAAVRPVSSLRMPQGM